MTFDPFALTNPPMKLGELGTFTIGDLTKSRDRKLQDLGKRMESLDEDADDNSETVSLICEQVALMLDGAPSDLAAQLMGLYDSDKIGLKALLAAQQHILEYQGLQEAVPN